MEVLTEMQTMMYRKMLRHHVGHEIFCPTCKRIMDCTRAVSFDAYTNTDKLIKTWIRCAPCYDSIAANVAQCARDTGSRLVVSDGRVLFAQHAAVATPRKRSPKPEPLVPGTVYEVKHTSGIIRARFVCEVTRGRIGCNTARGTKRYLAINLATGRDIELKSRARFLAVL